MKYCVGLLTNARIQKSGKNLSLQLLFGFRKKSGLIGTRIYELYWSIEKESYYHAALYTRNFLKKIIKPLSKINANIYGDLQIIRDWAESNRDVVFCINFSNRKEIKGALFIKTTDKIKIDYDKEMSEWPGSVFLPILKKRFSQSFINSVTIHSEKNGNYVEFVKHIKTWTEQDSNNAIMFLNYLGIEYRGNPNQFSLLHTKYDYGDFAKEYECIRH